MAWLRYNDMIEPSDPAPRKMGRLLVLPIVLTAFGGLGGYAYDLWRDWQRHRFNWAYLVGLLASLYLTALVVGAGRRAWRKVKGDLGASKTA